MKTNFHMKECAQRLALKKRLTVIRKWPIAFGLSFGNFQDHPSERMNLPVTIFRFLKRFALKVLKSIA